jgi:hypothetical protein
LDRSKRFEAGYENHRTKQPDIINIYGGLVGRGRTMAKKLKWYIEKYGFEEGTRRHAEIRERIGKTSKNKNTIEGFMLRYGPQEGTRRYDEFVNKSKHTKGGYIEKYGEDRGLLKWEEYINKKKITSVRRIEYWIGKGFPENEAKNIIKQVQSTCSLEQYISRYGTEEGTRRYLNKNNLHSYNISMAGFIKRYGESEGRKKFKQYCFNRGRTKEQLIEQYGVDCAAEICNSRGHTLANYIRWYGEEEGSRKYIERCKQTPHWPKQARYFFLQLYKQCRRLGLNRSDIYFTIGGSSEWFLKYDDGLFWYDFTIPKLNLIVEFNGEHVHPDLSASFEERNKWRHAYTNQTFNEVLEYENKKMETAKNNGFDVLIVWSKSNLTNEIIRVMGEIHDRFIR